MLVFPTPTVSFFSFLFLRVCSSTKPVFSKSIDIWWKMAEIARNNRGGNLIHRQHDRVQTGSIWLAQYGDLRSMNVQSTETECLLMQSQQGFQQNQLWSTLSKAVLLLSEFTNTPAFYCHQTAPGLNWVINGSLAPSPIETRHPANQFSVKICPL